jgi:mannose-6-phosphate isomerase-like protein (cupin superfamily)
MNQPAAPYVLTQGRARSHPGTSPTIKAGAADTAGLLMVSEGVLGPRTPGPPLHLHEDTDECWYVIEGRLLLQVGEDRHELGPGCFAWAPRQVPHAFANVSASPVRLLGIAVPGGIEDLLADQTAYFARLQGPPDLAELAAIGARHRSRLLGPPISVDAEAAAGHYRHQDDHGDRAATR